MLGITRLRLHFRTKYHFRITNNFLDRSFSTTSEDKSILPPRNKITVTRETIPQFSWRFDKAGYDSGQFKRTKDYEPSRDDNYDFKNWEHHTNRFRFFRHVFLIPSSSSFRRIFFPNLTAVALSSYAVTHWNTVLTAYHDKPDSMLYRLAHFGDDFYFNSLIIKYGSVLEFPMVPLTMTATVLGLLLVFRTNASHARFDTARGHWGSVINHTRVLLRLVDSYIPAELHTLDRTLAEPKSRCSRDQMIKLIKSFPKTLLFHLSKDGDITKDGCLITDSKFNTGCESDKDRALHYYLKKDGHDEETIKSIMDNDPNNRPWITLQLLSRELRRVKLDPTEELNFQRSIRDLDCAIGGCERILKTPIPTSYTRHTTRFLFLWTMISPFAIWSHCGIFTPLASIFVAYSLLSIEDIGVTIEQPFAVLPMWRYCEGIERSCDYVANIKTPFAVPTRGTVEN
eukprot:g2908.t1